MWLATMHLLTFCVKLAARLCENSCAMLLIYPYVSSATATPGVCNAWSNSQDARSQALLPPPFVAAEGLFDRLLLAKPAGPECQRFCQPNGFFDRRCGVRVRVI